MFCTEVIPLGYMTKAEFEKKFNKIQRDNIDKKLKQRLEDEKKKYKKKRKLPSTSKLILIGAVVLSLQIIIFCEHLMWKTGDLQAMYALIGIAASLTVVVTSYNRKARAENTAGGIVYETAMEERRQLGQVSCEEIINENEEIQE